MKKRLIYALALGAMFSFASCEKENENKSTASYTIPTYSLIVSQNVNGLSDEGKSVAYSPYKFNFDLLKGTVVLAPDLNYGKLPFSFATGDMPYMAGYYYGEDGGLRELIKFESAKQGNIYNIEGQIFTPANLPPYVNGAPAVSVPGDGMYLVMHYYYGSDYEVYTFWKDVTFRGTTTTSYAYEGENKQFSNKEMSYRVIMDIDAKKATVILYDAKFAEEMPNAISDIEIKDLTLQFNVAGYRIYGENITPSV